MLQTPQRFITVQARFVAFHFWPGAPQKVAFLREVHRHEFHVKAMLRVSHNNRQLEFFTVQAPLNMYLEKHWEGSTSQSSCEDMAQDIANELARCWGEAAVAAVAVSEDGENGALLEFKPLPTLLRGKGAEMQSLQRVFGVGSLPE